MKQTLYLYLVDEYTQKPVYDSTGIYPIEIDVADPIAEKHVAMMRLGIQAMAISNGVAGLVNLFFPFFPGAVIPPKLLNSANNFVDSISKSSSASDYAVVQNEIDDPVDGTGSISRGKRGGELREFQDYLKAHDEGRKYSGLRRVCSKQSGMEGSAIWVTPKSSQIIEEEVGETNTDKDPSVVTPINIHNIGGRPSIDPSLLSQETRSMKDWTVDEVCAWLNDVMHLEEVATNVKEAEIDGSVAIELSKAEWKEEINATGIQASKIVAAIKKMR